MWIGTGHPDKFAYVGGISPALVMLDTDLKKAYPALSPKMNSQYKLLYFSAGAQDGLKAGADALKKYLDDNGIRSEYITMPGPHVWQVFRRSFATSRRGCSSEAVASMPLKINRDLTATLVAGMKQMIVEGTLHPGIKLPPERDFAKHFGVNRASLRPALKALEVIGVIRQRVGDGTYLTEDASAILSVPLDFLLLVDGITFGELYEARRIFEPELAARAARRHTPDEIAQLGETVEEMKRQFESGSLAGVAACDQLHLLIWQMAGNLCVSPDVCTAASHNDGQLRAELVG